MNKNLENKFRLDCTINPLVEGLNKIIELLENVLEENMFIRDELANINCPHPLMTKNDVAEYLQVSIKTVENMIRRSELSVYYVGSLPRFKRKEVDICLKRTEVRFYN